MVKLLYNLMVFEPHTNYVYLPTLHTTRSTPEINLVKSQKRNPPGAVLEPYCFITKNIIQVPLAISAL